MEPTRRLTGDDGSVLAEAALLSPVLIYILFGVIEMGVYFRSYLTIGATATDGARIASIAGNASDADWQILQVIKARSTTVAQSTIVKVVIFHTTKPANGVSVVAPATCTAGVVRVSSSAAPNECNAYTPNDDWASLSVPANKTLYSCTQNTPTILPAGSRSAGWCAANRKVALTNLQSKGPPDYLGVYVIFSHKFITGLFGQQKAIIETIVTQLEPQTNQ